MDENRRAEIAAALRQYRETVTQHSFSLLRALVEAVEALPPRPDYSETAAQVLRLRRLDHYLGCSISGWLNSPRELLNDAVRDELIRRAGLDGVVDLPVNLDGREEYFAAIQARIAGLNVEVAEFPPADLAYLCTVINGITGPGLSYYRVSQQIEFVTCFREADLTGGVGVPVRYDESGEYDEGAEYDQLTWVWVDWEIAVAFQIGQAPFTGATFALYCRNEDNEQWKWRYGVHDGDWCSDVFGSVEEFLGYYAHFREQTEEDVRKDVTCAGLPV